MIIALMIGELQYQRTLNPISTRIIERAVELWRTTPQDLLACESQLMTDLAVRLGVPAARVRTACPESRGQTTRAVAEWARRTPDVLDAQRLRVVTHRLHVGRTRRIFRKLGLDGEFEGLAIPFDWADRDWKLRSGLVFRAYNLAAYAYCASRRWV
jgi:uncharacterized SAM-binding protein YcdF (DUF218 family)